MTLQKLLAEGLGTAFLLIGVVGSGIMAQNLAGDDIALALLANAIATGCMLYVIITTLGILAVAVFGNSSIWNITLIAAATLGFASTYLGVSLQSSIQADLPDDMRGRVMSIWIVVATGASALGAFTIGVATETLGLAISTWVLTGTCLAFFLWLIIKAKKMGGINPPQFIIQALIIPL